MAERGHNEMRVLATALLLSVLSAPTLAKLPPPSDEAKAKSAEATAKAAWSGKVGAYQLCKAMDRVAASYRSTAASAASAPPAPVATPACADPGPYLAAAPAGDKPLEASGAHSPAAMATSPPSSKATSAELTGPRK